MKNKVINLFDKNIVQNQGEKYSELLENFMSGFIKYFNQSETVEEIIDFSIIAWNFGNMKGILPSAEFKELENSCKREINGELLLKMVKYKFSKFKEHTNFIVDYDLKETDSDPTLIVITQHSDDYIAEKVEEMEYEMESSHNEMTYINRSSITLKPSDPFLDWFSNLYPFDTAEEIRIGNTYLIDEDIEDIEKWLRKKFDTLFILELEKYSDNIKEWPQKRNYKMFKLWFEIDTSKTVFDIVKRPIIKY